MDLFHLTDSIPTAINFGSYVTWTGYTVILVIIAAYFVHIVAPQAIGLLFVVAKFFSHQYEIFRCNFSNADVLKCHIEGSGIPEIKTIMRGTKLDEYLSARVLISKVVGLTLSLGAGLPIGNEVTFSITSYENVLQLNTVFQELVARAEIYS
jgi:chloride channel 2